MNTIYDQALEDVIMGDTVMLPDGSVVSDASKKAADTVALVSTGDFDIHIFGEPAVPVLALMVTDLSTGQSIPGLRCCWHGLSTWPSLLASSSAGAEPLTGTWSPPRGAHNHHPPAPMDAEWHRGLPR